MNGKFSNIEKFLKVFPIYEPYLVLKRVKNLFLSILEWKLGLGLFKVKPIILTIEPVRGCNINCVMCGAGDAKKQYMTFSEFKNIIDLFDESIYVFLYLWGEPFISKDITKMIRYASITKKKLVTIYSNFTILPDVEDLINSSPYEITASIDTFVPEKYEKIRKGAKFKNVMKNLEKLIYTKKRLKKSFPIISINSVISKETIEDIEFNIKTAIGIGVDKIKLQELFPFPRKSLLSPDRKDVEEVYKIKDKYKDKIKIEIMPFYGGFGKIFPKGYCFLAHFSVAIDINKDVLPCCMPFRFLNSVNKLFRLFKSDDNSVEDSFGNITDKEDVKDILHKRKEFLSEFRKTKPSFCSICPLYKS